MITNETVNLKIDHIGLSEEFAQQFTDNAINQLKILVQAEVKKLDKPEYLSLGEASSYLNCSRGKLKELIDDEGLKVTKINKMQRIKRSHLDDFMEMHTIN